MLRWIVLLSSLALWLGCMAFVYLQCKPVVMEETEEASRAALNRLFSEDAPVIRAWTVYADPVELNGAMGSLFGGKKPAPAANTLHSRREWNGLNENGLVKAGHIETRVKNKHDFSSFDEETSIQFEPPGTECYARYTGAARFTYDSGIDTYSSALKLGMGKLEFDGLSSGHREGGELVLTTNISQGGQTLYNGQLREKIGNVAALGAEPVPFQYNPDIRLGQEWTIRVLDFNLAQTGDAQAARAFRVKCIGNSTIVLDGISVRTYVVRSDDGAVRAWYSPDGVVQKQTYRLAGVLEIVLVRDIQKKK